MGVEMGVGATMLSHFSQRYPKIAAVRPEHSHLGILAFDLMVVRFNSLQWIPYLMPAAGALFEDPEKQDEPTQEEPSPKRMKAK